MPYTDEGRAPRTMPSPTRRRLMAGAAWSLPVLGITSAAPAYAASVCPDSWLLIPVYPAVANVVTFRFFGSSTGGTIPAGTRITVSINHLASQTVQLLTAGGAVTSLDTPMPANQPVTDPATWTLALGAAIGPGDVRDAFRVDTGADKAWVIRLGVEIAGCPTVSTCWSYSVGDTFFGNECSLGS